MIEDAIKTAVTQAIMSDEFAKLVARQVAAEIRAQAESESTEILKDKEVADIMRCSVATVRRKKRSGTIPTVQHGGVRVVRKCDLLGVKE